MPIPTGIATGVGSIFRTQVTITVAATSRTVLAAGWYYVYAVGANISIQAQDSTGTWQNLTAAGTAPSGILYSDGTNLAINNGAGAGQNATYIQVAIGG